MPKVSVLMPVYKTNETYLREAIESILNQTFTDFEFLILDDCPDDDREAIVASYSDKRIVYLKNNKNLGITPSRNKLIDMAKGEYLAVFDHDDVSLPTRLEKQVAYLDTHKNIGVVSCWVDCFPAEKKLHFPGSDFEIKKLLTEICSLVHSASMIRKSVLDNNNLRYEEKFSPAEDYCLWLRLIEFTQFHNIQEVLFKYRLYAENTSKTQFDKMLEATEKLHFWVRMKYPFLYQMYLNEKTKVYHIKLFKIPFLKVKQKQNRLTISLFGILPVIKIKKENLFWPE